MKFVTVLLFFANIYRENPAAIMEDAIKYRDGSKEIFFDAMNYFLSIARLTFSNSNLSD